MWLFNKKPKTPETKDESRRIIYKSEEFNVMQTEVVITLMDGRKIHIWVPGCVYQAHSDNSSAFYPPPKPFIAVARIVESCQCARNWIANQLHPGIQQFVDHLDAELVNESWIGEPKHAELGTTEDYYIEHNVAYWEDE